MTNIIRHLLWWFEEFLSQILELVQKYFDMRPKAIIDQLDLLRPIYKKTAVFGHFGREEPEFTSKKIDKQNC